MRYNISKHFFEDNLRRIIAIGAALQFIILILSNGKPVWMQLTATITTVVYLSILILKIEEVE